LDFETDHEKFLKNVVMFQGTKSSVGCFRLHMDVALIFGPLSRDVWSVVLKFLPFRVVLRCRCINKAFTALVGVVLRSPILELPTGETTFGFQLVVPKIKANWPRWGCVEWTIEKFCFHRESAEFCVWVSDSYDIFMLRILLTKKFDCVVSRTGAAKDCAPLKERRSASVGRKKFVATQKKLLSLSANGNAHKVRSYHEIVGICTSKRYGIVAVVHKLRNQQDTNLLCVVDMFA
jgi:hypothetical protein